MATVVMKNKMQKNELYLNDLVHRVDEVTKIEAVDVDDLEIADYEEVVAQTVIRSNNFQKFSWTTNNTKLLVKGYSDRRHRFRDPKVKKMDLWNEIIEEYGFPVNMDSITMKWRNMKKTYSQKKDKLLEENSGHGIKWEHYEIFDFLYAIDESKIDTSFLKDYFSDLQPVNKATTIVAVDEDGNEIFLNSETMGSNPEKFEWTSTLVKLLVKGYFDRRHLFKDPRKYQLKKKDLWHEISLEMMKFVGFSISEDNLSTKWKNLSWRYRLLNEQLRQGFLEEEVTTTILEFEVDDINVADYEEVDVENVTEFEWTKHNTKLLVKGFFERRHTFNDPGYPMGLKMKLWDDIIQEYGFPMHRTQLSQKWCKMKRTYLNIKKRLLRGNGRENHGIRWEHYEIFDYIYASNESAIDTSLIGQYFSSLDHLNNSTVDEDENHIIEISPNNFQKFEWTPTLVKILIKGYIERRHLFKDPKKYEIKKKDLWSEISQDMSSAGFAINEDALNSKWRNLNWRYRILKEKNDQGNLGQGVRWEYYDLFQLLYADGEPEIDLDFIEEYFSKLESEHEKEDIITLTGNGGSRQHFSWCPLSTDYLIKCYLARKESFRDPTVRKKRLWTEICKEMVLAGFQIDDADVLYQKMRNLKKTYKDYRVSKGSAPITWAYYDRLDEIFSDDPAVLFDTFDSNVTPGDAGTSESEAEVGDTNEEPENPNQQYQWCPRSTKFFLRSCIKRKDKFHDPNVIKKKLWTRVMEEMNVAGFPIKNINVLETKMENMTKTYKTIKEKNKKNKGRGLIRWEHLAAFDKFYTYEEKPRPSVPVVPEKPLSPITVSPIAVSPITVSPIAVSPITVSPTPMDEKKRKHPDQMTDLQSMRKKQLLVEEQKALLTERVHESLKETNQLLRERNDLLRKLINQRMKLNK